jgi:VWFA-related protein
MRAFHAVFLLFLLGAGVVLLVPVHGQTPTPLPDAAETDVVKITTKLVQVDIIVVDGDGRQVRDLSADDFEILQDGKPQTISGFSYIRKEPVFGLPSDPKEKGKAIVPPPKVTAANAGRIITFIVDDGNCSVSRTGIIASREGIEKFIREQMFVNDLVAIYQTRSGSSVFQQYTNDKELLLKAARKIQWYPPMGSCATNDGSFFAAAQANTFNLPSPSGTKTVTLESDAERKIRENNEDATNNNQVIGTLGVIRYVVQGLQRVQGRKLIFLLSDGLPLRSRDGQALSSTDVLRDLTELSNRSSVVFNTVDSRGLFDEGMIEARDDVQTQDNPTATNKVIDDRTRDVINSRSGLAFLADETGGKFFQGQNYLDVPIKKALSIETGYYLLAYEPSDETFKGKKFHKIQVKLKRPELKVISRSGFEGIISESVKPKRRSENSELYEAIAAPLPVPGLSVALTAYFGNSAEAGNFVRSFFHLEGNDIAFVDDTGGKKKAVLDVVAVTMNEKNQVVDEFTRTHTIKFEAAAIPYINRNGLIYSVDVPIKKPGSYNFRVAVRDSTSRMLGTAGQMVQIPDLRKPGIFVSGVTVTQVDQDGKFTFPAPSTAENAISLPPSDSVAAIRRFRAGSTLAYGYTVYNARLDRATGKPDVSVQVNLFKDGKLVIQGLPQLAVFDKQADWARIADFAYLRLNPALTPGDYALQVVITDQLASGKSAVSSSWVNFEVVR